MLRRLAELGAAWGRSLCQCPELRAQPSTVTQAFGVPEPRRARPLSSSRAPGPLPFTLLFLTQQRSCGRRRALQGRAAPAAPARGTEPARPQVLLLLLPWQPRNAPAGIPASAGQTVCLPCCWQSSAGVGWAPGKCLLWCHIDQILQRDQMPQWVQH